MKKSGIALLAVALFSALAAFSNPQFVTIQGNLENAAEKTFKLYQLSLFGKDSVCFATTDKNGAFTMQFEATKAGYYMLNCPRNYYNLYLEPGANILISGDQENLDATIHFTGEKAEPTAFLLAQEKEAPFPYSRDLYKSGLDEFQEKMDSYLEVSNQLLAKHKGQLPEKMVELEKESFSYNVASSMITYKQHYGHFHDGKEFKGDAKQFENKMLSAIDFERNDLLVLPQYKKAVKSYISYRVSELEKSNPNIKKRPNYKVHFQFVELKKVNPASEVANYLYTAFLLDHIKYNGINGILPLIEKHRNFCTNTAYTRLVMEEMNQWKHLAQGQPAPDFTFADLNGKQVSLSDFKGQYVYIDVWATWCAPCKAEMPHLKEVQKACKDYNIAFVQVSVDDHIEGWKEMVKEKGVSGTHLNTKGWDNPMMDAYNINSIPRFILIGPDGNIVNAVAPRPSEEVKNTIDKLEGITG